MVVAMHLQRPGQVTQAIDTGAVDGINVAPSDWGFVDMARIAAAGDIPVWQASNVDLGLFDAYRVHASAVAANCTMASDMCGNFVHEHSLLTSPLVRNGYAHRAWTAPDLGLNSTRTRCTVAKSADVPMSAELALDVDWAAPSAVLIALRQLHPVGA